LSVTTVTKHNPAPELRPTTEIIPTQEQVPTADIILTTVPAQKTDLGQKAGLIQTQELTQTPVHVPAHHQQKRRSSAETIPVVISGANKNARQRNYLTIYILLTALPKVLAELLVYNILTHI